MSDNGRSSDNGRGSSGGEADRYRQAATDALEMVDWCIGYMVGTHKNSIASALARNRKNIREQLLHEPAEPVPTSKD
jgi:hypothetical protein